MRRIIRKGAALLAACLLGIWNVLPVLGAEVPEVSAEGYVILEADSGEIVAGKNETEAFPPASTTKVLTALVTLEQAENLDSLVTFSHWAVTDLTEPSSTMIPRAAEGEQMPLRDVLYGLLLNSGNECANALAEYVAGSKEAFAEMMNERAEEIGASGSHFTNPHGLYEAEHYSTPYDMALIFREAMKNEIFYKIDTAKEYRAAATNKAPERLMEMGHRMVHGDIPCEGVFAGKTGLTDEGGRTLITEAERDGKRLIVVVMKDTEEAFYEDTEKLLDYGYALLDEQETERQSAAEETEISQTEPSQEGTLTPETGTEVTFREDGETFDSLIRILSAACLGVILLGGIVCIGYKIYTRKR